MGRKITTSRDIRGGNQDLRGSSDMEKGTKSSEKKGGAVLESGKMKRRLRESNVVEKGPVSAFLK